MGIQDRRADPHPGQGQPHQGGRAKLTHPGQSRHHGWMGSGAGTPDQLTLSEQAIGFTGKGGDHGNDFLPAAHMAEYFLRSGVVIGLAFQNGSA